MPINPIGLSATGLAVTGATDLAQITTIATDRPLIILGLKIVQSSDVGDAAEEVLRYGLYRTVTTGSTGGTALTVTSLNQGGPTPGAAGTANWTTPSTGGTLMHVGGFNIRVGEEFWYPEQLRPYLTAAGDPYSYRLLAAPADSLTLDVTIFALEG
jgi:hypothetical protein